MLKQQKRYSKNMCRKKKNDLKCGGGVGGSVESFINRLSSEGGREARCDRCGRCVHLAIIVMKSQPPCLCLSLSLCDWFSIHFRAGVVWHQNWTRPKQWNNPSRTDWLAARSRRQNSFSSLANEVVDTPATVPRQLLLSLFPLFHFTRSPFHHHLRLFALSVCVCI